MVAGTMREGPSVPWPGSACRRCQLVGFWLDPTVGLPWLAASPSLRGSPVTAITPVPARAWDCVGACASAWPRDAGPLACAWVWAWVCVGLGYSVMMTSTAPPPPITCAAMNAGAENGAMPANVAENIRPTVIAGLAKLVEEVKKFAAPM